MNLSLIHFEIVENSNLNLYLNLDLDLDLNNTINLVFDILEDPSKIALKNINKCKELAYKNFNFNI